MSKKVRFGQVTEVLVERQQGFVSVPSQGGCTLGMAYQGTVCRPRRLPNRIIKTPKMKNPRQRAAILKAAKVKIDKKAEAESSEIREKRRAVGCSCGAACKPRMCSCSLAKVACVTNDGSLCSCEPDQCENVEGRVDFLPTAVADFNNNC